MSFTRFFLFAASIIVLGGCAADATEATPGEADATQTSTIASGRVGSHGMVAFGTSREAYLSHIPMFAAPHDVQLVVRGSFAGESLPPTLSNTLYTFLPSRISLDALR